MPTGDGLAFGEEMNMPNWPLTAIASAFIGYFIPTLLNLLKYLIKHLFEDGTPVIKTEKWQIVKGINHSLKVKVIGIDANDNITSRYDGYVMDEPNFYTIRLKPKSHKEVILIRFKKFYSFNKELVIGLWSSFDYDSRSCVGPQILSKRKLDQKNVKTIIESISIDIDYKLMRIE
jgi:hypothetical protein